MRWVGVPLCAGAAGMALLTASCAPMGDAIERGHVGDGDGLPPGYDLASASDHDVEHRPDIMNAPPWATVASMTLESLDGVGPSPLAPFELVVRHAGDPASEAPFAFQSTWDGESVRHEMPEDVVTYRRAGEATVQAVDSLFPPHPVTRERVTRLHNELDEEIAVSSPGLGATIPIPPRGRRESPEGYLGAPTEICVDGDMFHVESEGVIFAAHVIDAGEPIGDGEESTRGLIVVSGTDPEGRAERVELLPPLGSCEI